MSRPTEGARVAEGITYRGGRYFVAIRLGAGRPMYRATFDTLAEAKAGRDRARADASAGRAVLDVRTSRVTVGEVAEAHLAAMAPAWSVGTRATHASRWRSLEATFGHRRVVELSVVDVEDWLVTLAAKREPRTVTGQLGDLRAILDRASKELHLPNVARLAKRPTKVRGVRVTKRRYTLTPEAVAGAIEAATPRYRIVPTMMLGLGLRSGEARGLTLDRVNLTTGEITIDRQLVTLTTADEWPEVDRLTPTLGFGPPKTDLSVGVAWAAAEILEAIEEHVELYGTGPQDLLVTGRWGQPLSAGQWTAEVKRIREATGVSLTGHDLRHTRGSWALDDGATIAEVAADLRHTEATSVEAYLHAQRPSDAARSEGVMARLGSAARKPRARGHLRAV